jgi:hypothetical protein
VFGCLERVPEGHGLAVRAGMTKPEKRSGKLPSVPGSRVASWLADALERYRLVTLVLLSIAFFYSATIRASAKPFWHDEIYTILLTGLPSLSTMWGAMRDGLDLAPPLSAVLTGAVRSLLGVGHVVSRLVPMLGFWAMTMALFAMVQRRANATVALTAALFPIFTAAYRHAYEARAYGLMMALFALVLFAWTEAAAGRRRSLNLPLLALALSAGLWNHYYAVFAYLPVVAGELTRALRYRRLDVGVVCALIVSGIAALPLLALLRAGTEQTSTFWAPASLDNISDAYYFLAEPLLTPRIFITFGVVVMLAVLGRVTCQRPYAQERRSLPAHEVAAGVACLLVPLAGVLLGVFVTGVFVPRYVLPGVIGLSLVIPLAIWAISARARIIEIALPLVFVVGYVELLMPVTKLPHPVSARPMLVASLKSPGPTAVTGGLTYLQLWYYAPTELKPRLTYIADPDYARRFTGSDTIDLGYLALGRWTPVNVARFEPFTEHHREFRVYAFGSGWLLHKLQEAEAQIDELGSDPGARLLRVRLP